MTRRTKKVGSAGRFGSRYGVRTRRRIQEVEAEQRKRHQCPRCSAYSVRRKGTGVWSCRRCGLVFAGGAYKPVVAPSIVAPTEEPEAEPEPEEVT